MIQPKEKAKAGGASDPEAGSPVQVTGRAEIASLGVLGSTAGFGNRAPSRWLQAQETQQQGLVLLARKATSTKGARDLRSHRVQNRVFQNKS